MQLRIGFSKRNMAFSRFLRWTERRDYSHCYVRFQNHVTKQHLILHAAGITIHTQTLENFKKNGNIIVKEYVLDIDNPDCVKDVLTFVYEQSGLPYGWIQLVGMGFVKFMAFFGKSVKNPLADERKTMVCSEFCAYVARLSGKVSLDLSYAEIGGPSWLDSQLKASNLELKEP